MCSPPNRSSAVGDQRVGGRPLADVARRRARPSPRAARSPRPPPRRPGRRRSPRRRRRPRPAPAPRPDPARPPPRSRSRPDPAGSGPPVCRSTRDSPRPTPSAHSRTRSRQRPGSTIDESARSRPMVSRTLFQHPPGGPMHVASTPEQESLRAELRRYFAGADDPGTARRADLGRGRVRRRHRLPRRRTADWARDGWLTLGWPKEYGGQERSAARPAHLRRRGRGRRGTGAVPDHQHRRPDDHALRHPGAARALPAPDRRRRAALLHRLLRARGRHRPRRAAHPRGPRRRRLRHQRPEDVDQPDPVRRLRLAGLPHRPGRASATSGLSILIVPTDAPGFSWTPVRTVAGPTTSATYYSDVRVPASALVGEENQGWGLITNQLNHERVALTVGRPAAQRAARGRAGPGARRPTAGASSTRSGCSCTWPGCTPRPRCSS